MSSHTRERYQALKAQGLCPLCGKRPLISGQAKCERCRDQFRRYQKKYHDQRRTQNLCLDCKKPVATSDNAYCPECIGRRNQYKHHRIEQRKAQGLCIDCGISPAKKERVRCADCLSKKRQQATKYRVKKPEYQIRERDEHACRICGRQTKLMVHHIDGNGHASETPNNSPDNLITLCRGCHSSLTKLASRPNAQLASDLLQILITSA